MIDERTLDGLSRGYGLLGPVLTRGVRPDDVESLEAIDLLASTLPRTNGDIDYDEINAEHHRVFGLEVFAQRGAYLDVELVASDADAIGNVLSRMAAHCTVGDDPADLHATLVEWIAPFCVSVRRAAPSSFFGELANLLAATVEAHSLAADRPVRRTALAEAFTLGDDDGLGALVNALLTPMVCGALLTRRDLAEVGSKQSVPTGFGSRRQTLKNLLDGAADFDKSDTVLRTLAERFGAIADDYDRWAQAHPALAESAASWTARARDTAQRLEDLASRVAVP